MDIIYEEEDITIYENKENVLNSNKRTREPAPLCREEVRLSQKRKRNNKGRKEIFFFEIS